MSLNEVCENVTSAGESADRVPQPEPPVRRAARNRIDDIEILRAIAIIFVLIEHAQGNLYPWFSIFGFTYFGGWDGVDLFFAISGFVIARSLLPSLTAAPDLIRFVNTALAFWVRRVWRLLPSAWLWLAIILIASVFFNTSGVFWGFKANLEGAVAAVLDVANGRLLIIFGHFDPGASFPYWSLSLEEQFYLLFPFLVLLSGKRLPLVVGIGILLQIFIHRSSWDITPTGAFFNMFRSDALLLGVLVAIWSSHPTYRLFDPTFLRGRPLVGFIVFAFLASLLGVVGSSQLRLLGGFQIGMVALISAILVLIASYNQGYFCPNGPLKQILLWIGSRSYGIYLIHIPVFFTTREIWFRLQPAGTIYTDRFAVRFTYTAVILLLALTELNYRFVETPLRVHGNRISKQILGRLGP